MDCLSSDYLITTSHLFHVNFIIEMISIDKFAHELAHGAGQIDPVNAVHPGLVYETSRQDYIRYLCSEGYNGERLRSIINEEADCSSIPNHGGQDDLNYPSILLVKQDLTSNISALYNRM